MPRRTDDDPDVDRARRRLLKVLVYTPPAIIGVVQMTQEGCAPASCGPQSCHPNGGCGPSHCHPAGP
jgi:hypothetical protein